MEFYILKGGLEMIFQSIPSLHMQKYPLEMFCKKSFLEILQIVQESTLYWSLLLIKSLTLRPATLLKRDCSTFFFSVNFSKFSRALILKNICERLLLYVGSVNSILAAEISKVIRGPLSLFPYPYCVTYYVVMHSFLRLL